LAKNIYAVEKDEERKEEKQKEMREIKRECRDAVAINKLGKENGEETLPFDHGQMCFFGGENGWEEKEAVHQTAKYEGGGGDWKMGMEEKIRMAEGGGRKADRVTPTIGEGKDQPAANTPTH
jgi:hypothetical protein